MDSHGFAPDTVMENIKQDICIGIGAVCARALRQAIPRVREGGTVSIVGVYGDMLDTFPPGALTEIGVQGRSAHAFRYGSMLG